MENTLAYFARVSMTKQKSFIMNLLQHADYQKHISVLKESLIAKEEHYNMLQLDVSIHCYANGSLGCIVNTP